MVQLNNEDYSLRQVNFGEGLNSSEQLLKKLGDQSFLRFWSHANTRISPTQEVCDLLVVCGDNVILFSDKTAEFDVNADPGVAWRRWYRKAVTKSSNQLSGATRVVTSPHCRIYKDRVCQVKLGIPIPPSDRMELHRVAVVSFPKAEAEQRLLSPILSFDSSIAGDQHIDAQATPFVVGDVLPNSEFVHVMDDAGLRAALTTLDTISDFSRYLDARKKFIRHGSANSAENELCMLARYLLSFDEDGVPLDIDHESSSATALTTDEWNSLEFLQVLADRAEANRESYVWDSLIENQATLVETQGFSFSTVTEVAQAERVVRHMALESRLNRRLLSRAWKEVCLRDNPEFVANLRTVPHSSLDVTSYVFLNVSNFQGEPTEIYRAKRRDLLQVLMLASLIDVPTSKVIIGIAAEYGALPESYDLAHFNVLEDADFETLHEDAMDAWTKKRSMFGNLVSSVIDERDIPYF